MTRNEINAMAPKRSKAQAIAGNRGGLEHFLPVMLTFGVNAGRISIEDLARIGAELGRRLHEKGMHWWDKQLAEYDPAKRAALVKQMQSWLYDSGYMNVMAYPNAVEAYRTDQIKSITTMPSAAGNIFGQDGYWSWWSAVPASGKSSSEGGSSTGVIIGIAVAAVVLAGGGVLIALRRRSTAEDRE